MLDIMINSIKGLEVTHINLSVFFIKNQKCQKSILLEQIATSPLKMNILAKSEEIFSLDSLCKNIRCIEISLHRQVKMG